MSNSYIALDLGNVCIKLDIQGALERFGFLRNNIEEIPEKIKEILAAHECGKASQFDLVYALRCGCEKDLTDTELMTIWNSIVKCEMPRMAELIREGLQMGYRFAFLSDTSPSHFYRCVSMLSFSHLVDGRIVSYEVGAKKPNRAMFESFERYFGVPVLYFDDRIENINAARNNHHWHAHLFTSVEDALKALKKLPILPAEF